MTAAPRADVDPDLAAIDRHLAACAAATTAETYRRWLERWAAHLRAAGRALVTATGTDVAAWQAGLATAGRAPRSRALALSAVRWLYRRLAAEGLVAADPTRAAITPRLSPAAPPAAVDLAVLDRLCAPPPAGLSVVAWRRRVRDRALARLLRRAGLCATELVALRLADVDLPRALLTVARAGRRLPLSPADVEALAVYLAEVRPAWAPRADTEHGAKVFLTDRGTGLTRQAVWKLLRRQAGPGCTTRAVRAARARALLADGTPTRVVGETLGLADPWGARRYLPTAAGGGR